VSNLGGGQVNGARIIDTTVGDVTTLSWTCAPQGGAQCPASGSGNIDFFADLPAGSHLQITLSAQVPALPETPLSNNASVSAPATWRDTDSSNDSASDGPDVRGIFRDGLEP
jgi:hypothetical protein